MRPYKSKEELKDEKKGLEVKTPSDKFMWNQLR